MKTIIYKIVDISDDIYKIEVIKNDKKVHWKISRMIKPEYIFKTSDQIIEDIKSGLNYITGDDVPVIVAGSKKPYLKSISNNNKLDNLSNL
jgi:hypothetical protein